MSPLDLRVVALVLTATSACSGAEAPVEQQTALEWHLDHNGGPVAARVDGTAIPLRYVQARARETQEDLRRALEQLIDEELLVREAVRRRMQRKPPIQRLLRRALVNRLLRLRFVERFDKSDIPSTTVEMAYEKNRFRFDRPELVRVSHILASADEKASPEKRRAALAAAKHARRLALGKSHTAQAFRDLKLAVARDHEGIQVISESLITPRHGRVVESFGAAAFALRNKGNVSPVVATRYGYHVIYLEDRKAAIHRSVAQADAEIRDLIFDEARASEVGALLARLTEATAIARFPENLPPPGESN